MVGQRQDGRENVVQRVWNLMAHGDAREGKWRGKWRVEWVASTLTLPRKVVYPALLTLMCTPRLSAVDWTDSPVDLNGVVRFGERRNLVSACVPSGFKRTIPLSKLLLATQCLHLVIQSYIISKFETTSLKKLQWVSCFPQPTAAESCVFQYCNMFCKNFTICLN